MNRDTRLLTVALALWGLGEGLFLYIQPLYLEYLGASPVQIGRLLSAASMITALTFLPAGLLADRLPRKPLMLGAWALGPVAVLLMGLAATWEQVIPGLLLYACSAYCVPVINAYVAHAADGCHVERTLAGVFAGYTFGGVVSPALGGWLAHAGGMRTVYFAAGALFVLSTLTVLGVSPQRVRPRTPLRPPWHVLLEPRFLRFAGLTWFAFLAMYLGFPLAPNFLADTYRWDVARIGALGSFQALGMTVLSLFLGWVSAINPARRLWAFMLGHALVWGAAALLLLSGAFPWLAVAFLLRGAYQGVRVLTAAYTSAMAHSLERGLLLGAMETTIAFAQVVSPFLAGSLYAFDPARPLQGSLVLIPLASLALWAGAPRVGVSHCETGDPL